jgi:sensor histidine kinase regulating citrate/malate metabolism
MIIEKTQKTIVQSHDFDSVNCTIDAEDMRYVASLLRNNYSNTRLAVIREISANALDANTEANSKRKIEIVLPSNMNPTFSVRDFGGGLSQEDVFGLYSKYGKSTKRESNNYIGAFGIGKVRSSFLWR